MAQAFLTWQSQMKRRSKWTTYKGAQLYEKLIPFLHERGTTLARATEEDLTAFLHRPRPRVAAPADSTLAGEIWKISRLYTWLSERSLIPSAAAARLLLQGAPNVHNEQPKPVSADLWHRFWTLGNLTDTERTAFGLGYFCGLRRAEVMSLRPAQFQGDRIGGIVRKGGERSGFPLVSTVQFWIERLPAHGAEKLLDPLRSLVRSRRDSEYLLPWHDEVRTQPPHKGAAKSPKVYDTPSSPNVFNARLNTALERNGILRSTITPHMLRHSFCTYLLSADVPIEIVSQLAGHRKIQTTLRYSKAQEDPLALLLMQGRKERPLSGTRREGRLRFTDLVSAN